MQNITEEKQIRLKALLQDPKVLEYINLSNELKNTKPKCQHEIWLYSGSYYTENDDYGYDYMGQVENELDEKFCFNIYKCQNCNKEIRLSNWRSFEEEHIIIKNNNYKKKTLKKENTL